MLHKTRGIILQTIPYSDSSIIVKAYTELFGLQSFMISGVRRKKSDTKINALQPLSLVEMIIYHKEGKQLNRVKEIKSEYVFTTVPYDIAKSSIALFLNEIIFKSIKEEEANLSLFEFLYNSLKVLDLKTDKINNFHLQFMVRFSKILGFYPQGSYSAVTSFFDLTTGTFIAREPVHPYSLGKQLSSALYTLMESNYDSDISLDNASRRLLLEKLILFYELHISTVKQVNSHKVLEEVVS